MRADADTTAPPRRGLVAGAVALLIGLFVVQAVTSLREKSVTVDEITYIAAGYYHLETGDFRYNTTNPPLLKMLAAAPLLALDPELPPMSADRLTWGDVKTWKWAREFFYGNRVDADRMLFAARLPSVLLGAAVGLGVFVWSRALFGVGGGLLSLLLFAFSPNLLAHTRLATQDIGLTAALLASSYGFWRLTEQPRLSTLLWTGLCFGVGVAAKTTMLFAGPIFVLYALVRLLRSDTFAIHEAMPFVAKIAPSKPRARQLVTLAGWAAVIGLLTGLAINAAHGFQGTFDPISSRFSPQRLAAEDSALRPVVDVAFRAPLLLPTAYLDGLAYQRGLEGRSARLFFAGEIYEHGAWWLIFAAVLLKTPLPMLAFAGIVAGIALWRRDVSRAELLLWIFVLFFLFMFCVMRSLASNVRYVLPIFPVLFILAGRLAVEVEGRRIAAAALAAACVWYVAGTALLHPHYLAHFNELAGGPSEGYRWLAESNLDWGQDLKGLKRYMDERDIDHIRLGYFGSGDADYYGISYDYLPSIGLPPKRAGEKWWYELDPEQARPLDLAPGLVAVSANLVVAPGWIGERFGSIYEPLRELEPIDSVGYSILIYDIP